MTRQTGQFNAKSLRTRVLNLLSSPEDAAEPRSVKWISRRLDEPERAVRAAVDALKYNRAIESIGPSLRSRGYRIAPDRESSAYFAQPSVAPEIPKVPREWWEV